MSALIEEFKSEHSEIVAILNEAKDKNFPHLFEEFFGAISRRIKNDGEVLYGEYEKNSSIITG